MPSTELNAKVAALRRCQVFSRLPTSTLEFLAELTRVQRFSKGEAICEQDEVAREVFVVERGSMSVVNAETGDVVGDIGPGDLFGEFGMFGRGVRVRSVIANEDSTVLSLEYDRFRAFLLSSPESTLRLLEVAIGRFVELGEKKVA